MSLFRAGDKVYVYANHGHTGMVGEVIEQADDSLRVATHIPRRLEPYGFPRGPEPARTFTVRPQEVRNTLSGKTIGYVPR